MFFATFANLLSSIPTFLFPVFASYKALKTNDPALLQPWLMYWVVLAIALFVESWTGFILFWIPFYAWIRLGFLLYLILPQTQGAKVLYQEHVHPYLLENERLIDDFISSAHDRAKSAGITYLKQIIELIKQHAFGMPPHEPTPPSTPTTYSYTQSLIARFNIPSARPAFPGSGSAGGNGGGAGTANDFYSLLASAVTAATSSSQAPTTRSPTQRQNLSNSGTLIPPTLQPSDRLSFISAQRERLSILLSALDKEASNISPSSPSRSPAPRNHSSSSLSLKLDGAGSSEENEEHLAYGSASGVDIEGDVRPRSSLSGISSRKSEVDFEKIEAESGAEDVEERKGTRRTVSSGWMPWSWGARGEDTVMGGVEEHAHED